MIVDNYKIRDDTEDDIEDNTRNNIENSKRKSIRDNILKLIELDDIKWGYYAFSKDPLGHKPSTDEKQKMILEANKCGTEEAKKLLSLYGDRGIGHYINQFNIKISYEKGYGSDNYIVFATYNYPNQVRIYKGNVEKTKSFVEENQIKEILGFLDIESILIAHELYHFVEEHAQDIYTRTKKFTLWKLGFIEYQSRLIALSEIAAMAFTKELLQLPYNPYLLDIVMLYPHNYENTQGIVDKVLRFN